MGSRDDVTVMVPCTLNGRWPMLLPEHRAARPEWTEPPWWEPERLAAMCASVEPGDVVYDVGTEEGDISALLASWAGPHGRLVLMEPNCRVWPNVRAIFEANRLTTPAMCWVGFAGDEPRDGRTGAVNAWSFDDWPECADGPVIGDHGFAQLNERPDLPTIRLDDVAALATPPDVITMDVEGSELRVLRGAAELLAARHPLVFVSVHPTFMREQYGDQPADLMRFMAELGYASTHLATDHEVHVAFAHPDGRALVES